MALQTIAGQGLWMPAPPLHREALSGGMLIDATGEKAAFSGRVFNKDRTSKNITKVGFRFGAVTKAGGSALTVSLQDVNLAAGPPMQPDETQDQTVAIANANASFVSNTWIQTGTLSATRTVAFGELLSVVIEYDGAGRLAADSVVISGMAYHASTEWAHQMESALKTGGTWAAAGVHPNVILEFDDGTFGTLVGALPFSAASSLAFKSDTAVADEHALEFTVPFPCKVDGFWAFVTFSANTSNFDVVLYDGTSAMTGGTVTVDANTPQSTSTAQRLIGSFSQEITLAANTIYRLAIKPTQTTSTVSLYYIDVNDANHFQALEGGTSWRLASRIDLGAWAAAVTTRRPLMGIHVSALDDGVSTGGSRGTKIIHGHEGVRVY